ncbi:helicase HerA-like domain-containing protein [uncultured Lamprocystis sp.]|jgi:DNA helicase HerA-like ATPase|uniref:helicase HerA-like domain-containing protein n=1 Tax=uncultured Lamprocystis sp. TaxID=543132 RepID=UPI0025DBCFB2|nr:helicase HerA-like domain-containing protein [uncultured Lamprocystis sp.]
MTSSILVGKGQVPVAISLRMANRHGLVAGATGTGKTVTLQRLAEQFSRAGVPVFMADVKGDLAGISQPGGGNKRVAERVAELDLEQTEGFDYAANPVMFWDIQGKLGHPVRTTISELGPMLLGRLLELNDVQEGVLNIVFQVADENGWLLLDLKDLRALLSHVAEQAETLQTRYGNVSKASVGAILRRLLALEQQGAQVLFGEPALTLADLMQTDERGHGYVNILAAETLIHTPALYSTFLLWLLAELFETLPEVGDADKPKMVFFFDEAHLLFNDAPKVLLNKIEQVVRLIRSKGVGVYFVTQSPLDVPDTVLGQLGNRVQHALRAFTPRDQKAVRVAAETFRQNPDLDTATVITALGVGEALVSTLDEQGIPGIVQRVTVAPPGSRLGPVDANERRAVMDQSLVKGVYDVTIDRVSAYEMLEQRANGAATAAATPAASGWGDLFGGSGGTSKAKGSGSSSRQSPLEAFASSAARSLGTQIGRQLMRGVMGSLFGTKTGGKR